jgi:hypothetical protein
LTGDRAVANRLSVMVVVIVVVVPVVGVGVGCASLPDISGGVCGNHVVEPHEDCDSFAAGPGVPGAMSASVCIPKGSIGECHLDCSRRVDGSRPACPAGWGCAVQGICRPPTGDFEAPAKFKVGGAASLMTGDFDGDGRADLLDLEQPDAHGVTKARFLYFDEDGALSETHAFPKPLGAPVITRPSGATRSDVVFTDSRFSVGVLLGQADRSEVPEAFNSYHLQSSAARLIAVYDRPIGDSSGVVFLTTVAGAPGFYVVDQSAALRRQAELPGAIDTLIGDPVTGDLIEDAQLSPCREVVLAVRGATSFRMVDTCARSPETAEVVWRDEARQWTIALDPPVAVDAAPQLVDMNGDGHLDVLIGAGGKPYVAFGDGRGLGNANPYRLALANPADVSPDIPMPLAAGDFSGDGAVDFVFDDHLLVSTAAASGTLPIYLPDPLMQRSHWTTARIADLNGNGKLDVVAASSDHLGIDFFNGNGTPYLLPFTIPTNGPVQYLAVTDLDGDLIDDLAFIEPATSTAERDAVMIAFGTSQGPPAAGIPVARIHHVEGLSVLFEFGRGNLVVSSTAVGSSGESVLAVLEGGGDHLPFAPYRLVDISTAGFISTAAAIGVTVGAFSAGGRDQVLALTTTGDPESNDYQFWLLPALETAEGPAVSIGGRLDPRVQPLYAAAPDVALSLVGAAADVDGDGRDEAIWAMSADETTHCALVIVDATSAEKPEIVVRDPIVLDEPCLRAQLLPIDADGDGNVDIALLNGAAGQADRKLLVLWNDGAGGFASSDVATVNVDGESPEQFTVLPATPDRPLAFAYVSGHGLWQATAMHAGSRVFGPSQVLAELERGTGIVAADVNRDGVLDLAVADSGDLRILKAKLAPP